MPGSAPAGLRQLLTTSGNILQPGGIFYIASASVALNQTLFAIANAPEGAWCEVWDADDNASVNNITINRSGSDTITFGGTSAATGFIGVTNSFGARFVSRGGIIRVTRLR